VLVFYGPGGSGKTWLLRTLRQQARLPSAWLDFDRERSGKRFVLDPAAALQDIRQQLERPTPRFDLAFAMLLHKQGATEEPKAYSEHFATVAGLVGELASPHLVIPAAIIGAATAKPIPAAGTLLKLLSKPILKKIKGTPIEAFLAQKSGRDLVLELRAKNSQQISDSLLDYLAEDLCESLAVHLHRAVRAVVLLDTFEAVSSDLQSEEHRREQEKWIRDLAEKFDFALIVVAGQNRLNWDEVDPDRVAHLDQRALGGLAERDAREFLTKFEIGERTLQDAILSTAREDDGSHHCLSLGLCVDVVVVEREGGVQTSADSLRLTPRDFGELAHRFLKSLRSDEEREWIRRLALTPRFDQHAAKALCGELMLAHGVMWRRLRSYSFVDSVSGLDGWLSVRSQMRWVLESQSATRGEMLEDHEGWRLYWAARSTSSTDEFASLAWYHRYCVAPEEARRIWAELAKEMRRSVPPRMAEHLKVIEWWEPLDLLASAERSAPVADAVFSLAYELRAASLGNIGLNQRRAIACYEAAPRVYTEQDFPRDWATTQSNLGAAWSDLLTGDRGENLRRAIAFYEAALRVRTEQDFPQDWATTQNNLGIAWGNVPTGDRGENLRRAIAFYEAALRVRTERDFPQDWAMTQNNLGIAWSDVPTGDRGENLRRAIACYEAALRVFEEQDFPQDWAMTQNNLGIAWGNVLTGDRGENLRRAIAFYEAALRVHLEQDFPQDWAMTQNNLGNAWSDVPTGDRGENLGRAIAFYEAALRVFTEQDFPQDWATTKNNLGLAWSDLPSGNRGENLRRAIACYKEALRVRTEQDFPQNWAMTQNNLGLAWSGMLTGDRGENLRRAIGCYDAALRVYTEQDFPHEHGIVSANLLAAHEELDSAT
jgi:predicted enzyme related to lactoylglutathione lyase